MYIFDTSAFVVSFRRWYRPASFPKLWDLIDSAIDSGEIVISEEVWREIDDKEDEIADWLKTKKGLFRQTDDSVWNMAQEILQKENYQYIVKQQTGRNYADTFIIALAKLTNGVVVTYETSAGSNKGKIPDICRKEGVRCMSFPDFINNQGWTF